MRQHSQIFMKRSDKALMILLILTLAYLFMELLTMQHKYHFLNLMIALGLLSIFSLNYFDKTYIRLHLILLVLSEILDLVWMIVKSAVILYY
jgi:hypothetical protein